MQLMSGHAACRWFKIVLLHLCYIISDKQQIVFNIYQEKPQSVTIICYFLSSECKLKLFEWINSESTVYAGKTYCSLIQDWCSLLFDIVALSIEPINRFCWHSQINEFDLSFEKFHAHLNDCAFAFLMKFFWIWYLKCPEFKASNF